MAAPRQYALYADLILIFHSFWTLLVWGGGVLVVFYHPYAPFQIAVLTVTLLSSLPFRGNCPLTFLEEKFRKALDPSYTNQGSFMTTYGNKLFGTHFRVKTVNTAIVFLYIISYAISILAMVRIS